MILLQDENVINVINNFLKPLYLEFMLYLYKNRLLDK